MGSLVSKKHRVYVAGMTPAIDVLNKTATAYSILEYEHDASSKAYGLEAVEKLEEAIGLAAVTVGHCGLPVSEYAHSPFQPYAAILGRDR